MLIIKPLLSAFSIIFPFFQTIFAAKIGTFFKKKEKNKKNQFFSLLFSNFPL